MAIGEKIKRKLMAHFVNAGTAAAPIYEKLGQGIEEMVVEMGANVVKTNDITGVTETYVDRYEKVQAVEPYFCREGNALFERLQAIVDDDQTLDGLNADTVDVKLWEPEKEGRFPAVREGCVIEVVSFGGNTEGYAIPFQLHRTGVKVKGSFDLAKKEFTVAP